MAKAKAATAGSGKEIANRKPGALATADERFAKHAGAGLQNVTARDILIPRITILQSNSPQVTKGHVDFMDEARPGQIFDVNMKEIIGDEMIFLPIIFSMAWLEWAPRISQKGLIQIHPTADILDKTHPEGGENDSRKPMLPNGNYIAETAQFYGLNVSSSNRLSFLPMASTQLKKARLLNTLATGEKLQGADGEYTPPLFYRMYKFTTVPENNAKGNWLGWKIERGPRLEDLAGWEGLFDRMLIYSEEINKGQRKGDLSSMQEDVERTETGDQGRM